MAMIMNLRLDNRIAFSHISGLEEHKDQIGVCSVHNTNDVLSSSIHLGFFLFLISLMIC